MERRVFMANEKMIAEMGGKMAVGISKEINNEK